MELANLCALPALLLEIGRRLEVIHVQPRFSVEARHYTGRLDAVEAAVADQTSHHRAVLVLIERLIVLLVRPASA